jgi:alkylhydroperoxidase family enzyme
VLGFDDRAILDAALTVAYFSFVNRLVLLLGVEVEKDYASTCGPETGT